MEQQCTITEAHCQQCGETSPEFIQPRNPDFGGYTGCCGELISQGPSPLCYHDDE